MPNVHLHLKYLLKNHISSWREKKWRKLPRAWFLVSRALFEKCHGLKNRVTGITLDFCHGHSKKCHGHFFWSKIVTAVFSMSRAFLRKLSRARKKMSRGKKNTVEKSNSKFCLGYSYFPSSKISFRLAIFRKDCSNIHFLKSCVPKRLDNFILNVRFSEKLSKT